MKAGEILKGSARAMAGDEASFTGLGGLLDEGEAVARKGVKVALHADAQIIRAFGLGSVYGAVLSGIAKVADVSGAHELASSLREGATVLRPDSNRAHLAEIAAKVDESAPSLPPAPAPQTLREKVIAEQEFLKEAGYGYLLARHHERGHGVDGIRGRDTKAAEKQFRLDHHLAANEVISGGESVHVDPKAPVTPGAGKYPRLREI